MTAAERQRPIGSGFGAKSTAAEVLAGVDLAGREAIVTGGYSGIGLETVRALLAAGARVTVPARSVERARAALAGMDAADGLAVAEMNLADLGSVRRFADGWVGEGRALYLLFNNAGIMATPLERVGLHWESQFAVNHLGHFELARRLLPALAEGARVVALSSVGHAGGGVLWDDPHFERAPYNKWRAYAQAKTANALFALEADRRWGASRGVRAFSAHPGGIFTPLQRHLPNEELVALGWKNVDGTTNEAARDLFKTPEQGAATTLWAATDARLAERGGAYCEDCDVARLAGPDAPRWAQVRAWACDEEDAARLWTMSEAMIAQ